MMNFTLFYGSELECTHDISIMIVSKPDSIIPFFISSLEPTIMTTDYKNPLFRINMNVEYRQFVYACTFHVLHDVGCWLLEREREIKSNYHPSQVPHGEQ